jgi:hypothetical protein
MRVGEAQTWTTSTNLFAGSNVIETAMMRHGTTTWMYYNCNGNKVCRTQVTNEFWTQPVPYNTQVLSQDCRFFSFFTDSDGSYNLVCNEWSTQGKITLYKSTDLNSWTVANNGLPLITAEAGTTWENIWNVSIVRSGDTYIMLAEAGPAMESRPNGPGMDLYISSAQKVGGVLDFKPGRVFDPVIPNSGNPDLRLLGDGETLFAFHGMYRDNNRFGGAWYITASTAKVSDLTNWTVKRDEFALGENGIDIADPALHVGYDGAYIMYSYDQRYQRIMNPSRPLKETIDSLIGR